MLDISHQLGMSQVTVNLTSQSDFYLAFWGHLEILRAAPHGAQEMVWIQGENSGFLQAEHELTPEWTH